MARPGRPEQPLDSTGPLPELARELRRLRRNAGLTYNELAAKTGLSEATLRTAAHSKQLPTWSTTRAFITACDGDEGRGRSLYNDACRAEGRPVPSERPARPPVPVPGEVTTAAQFVDMLKLLRVWAGNPSLAALSKHGSGHLPTSTVSDMLNSQRLPRLDLTQAFVRACGLDEDQADAWEVTWADIRSRPRRPVPPAQEPAPQQPGPDQHGHPRLRIILALCLVGLLTAIITLVATGSISLHWMGAASAGPENFIIVPSATANEPEPVLSAAIWQQLQSAGLDSAKATAYVVTPSSGQALTLALTPHLPNGNTPARARAVDASIAAVQQAVEHQAAQGPFDLLADITAAVNAAPAPATLIVISSGLSTAGGFDMQQVGWGASPSTIAAQLKSHGLLPDLAGYHVIFSGLGATSGRQPALPVPAQQVLNNYWMAICRATGAASCTTDATTRSKPPSRSLTPVPVVPVPAVTSTHGPHDYITTTLPDALLFGFNSATLLPAANSVLQPLAQQALTHDERVSITGYASPDGGTAAYNRALSRQRAQAVRNRLIALGLPPSRITGVTGAGTAGQPRGACLVNGQLDEALCAKLRRVIIVFTPAATTP
jgi:outer membrane protein OmpA-like peptidoglycan-associated protein/DNA-binding XRE family transcriptional regulator